MRFLSFIYADLVDVSVFRILENDLKHTSLSGGLEFTEEVFVKAPVEVPVPI
jgi:hypothetical protein